MFYESPFLETNLYLEACCVCVCVCNLYIYSSVYIILFIDCIRLNTL